MSEEILINVTPQETRVAVMQQGVAQEIHIERTASRGLVGSPESAHEQFSVPFDQVVSGSYSLRITVK